MWQLVLPECLQEEVFQQLNTYHGHQVERTTELIQQRCYWPGMGRVIKDWCQRCSRCSVAKNTQPQIQAPMGHLLASRPNEILALDFSLLEPARDGREQVLVMSLSLHRSFLLRISRPAQLQRLWLRNGSTRMEFQLV